MGRNISADEQTIGFKGQHQDKQRISYKREGDGFLADTLCESGFTYTFYFRNMPPPKHYISKGCSALHARVLFMFDQLKSSYHICGMDNLYNSVKFCRDAFTSKNKVMGTWCCKEKWKRSAKVHHSRRGYKQELTSTGSRYHQGSGIRR